MLKPEIIVHYKLLSLITSLYIYNRTGGWCFIHNRTGQN